MDAAGRTFFDDMQERYTSRCALRTTATTRQNRFPVEAVKRDEDARNPWRPPPKTAA